MNISNSLSRVLKSIQSSHSEQIVLQTLLYPVTSHQDSEPNSENKIKVVVKRILICNKSKGRMFTKINFSDRIFPPIEY